jgi:hypothetical protein
MTYRSPLVRWGVTWAGVLVFGLAWPAHVCAQSVPRIEVIDPNATTGRPVVVRIDGRYYTLYTTPVQPIDPQPGPTPPQPQPIPDPSPPAPQPDPSPPPPIPPPEPAPTPYVGKLWVLFIAGADDGKAWSLAVDSMMRSALATANAELRTYKMGEENITRQNLTKAIADAGGPPVVLIQKADGKLARSVKPTNTATIVEAVKAVREGRP